MKTYYFVLPAYNEEGNLKDTLEAVARVRVSEDVETKILVVDDGSTDATPHILRSLQSSLPLSVVTHSPNKGIPKVFESASAHLAPLLKDEDVVIILESDGTSDLACVPLFRSALDAGADIVIASRHVHGGAYVRFPWYRVLGSTAVNVFLTLLWRIKNVHDYTMFYRAYKGKVFKKFHEEGGVFVAKKSFAANGELLYRLAKYKPRIEEVPLRYDYGLKKGPSKMRLIQTLLEYIRLTLSLHKKA